MKLFFIFLLIITSLPSFAADSDPVYHEETFKVLRVGGSNNTNTVFIDVDKTASYSSCATNKIHFKIPDDDKHSDRFFALMLTAQATGKSVILGYFDNDCVHGGIVPSVFKISS